MKLEYMVESFNFNLGGEKEEKKRMDKLNKLGSQGWELIESLDSATTDIGTRKFLFKRRKRRFLLF